MSSSTVCRETPYVMVTSPSARITGLWGPFEPLVRSLTYKKLPASYEKQFYFQYDCEVIEWEGGNPAGGIKKAE